MRGFFIVFLIISFPNCFYGQTKVLVPIISFSAINDKSVANVRAIIKDKYGFVWIGTQDGLIRYDGRRTINYNKNTTNSAFRILNNDIDALISIPDSDFLWVLSSYGGISMINLLTGKVEKKISLSIGKGHSSNFLFTGIEYNSRFIYVAAEDGYIFKINAATGDYSFTKLLLKDRNEKVQKFCSVNNHFLLCLSSSRLVIYDSTFNIVIAEKSATHLNNSFRFIVSAKLNQEEVILGTSEGLRTVKFNITKNELDISFFGNAVHKTEKVKNILIDKKSIWVAYNNSIINYLTENNSSYEYLSSKGYEENKWLSAATYLVNIDGQIWIGSEYGIAIIKKENPFLPYFQDIGNTIKLNHCFALFSESDSIIYTCTAEAFYRVNINNTEINKIGKDAYFINCFKGPGKRLFVSGFGGTFINDRNSLIPVSNIFPTLLNLNKDVIIASENYRDSLYFFASVLGKGLFIYDFKKNRIKSLNIKTSPVELKSNSIKRLFIDRLNRLWILCDNLISLYDIKLQTITHHSIINPKSNEPLNIIKDLCYLKNSYFLAVYGMGIVQLNENLEVKKIFSTQEGIQNVNLYKIFSIGDSLLIASSNEGLYTININNQTVKCYFEDFGLHSNAFEELSGTINKAKVYLGGINGFTELNPENLKINKKRPLIYINKIIIEIPSSKIDTSNILISSINIPNNVLQTNIYFSGINFSNPKRTTFAYRIIENTQDWINLNTQDFVTLIGLSPGTYHLQVKAANEDGIWSEPKELTLIFEPKWYQTWWFKLLVFLTTAGIIYAFYRYRIRQIKKQHEIRKNIATDLHDDLGSTLNSVKVFTNLAISGVKQEESLQQVKDNLTEATMSLRDMIWVLDDSLDTVDELVTRLKQFAMPVAAASNMEAIIKADNEVNSRQLTKEEKRNLFLICKEVINNSIKYSGASRINITITASGKKIQIVVADNGKGFNVDEVKKGYGLKNMQYRAGQIKYKVTLVSLLGKGTQVEIKPA